MPVRLPAHRSADLIWLLRVDLGGTPHYLSTEQISLSRDDGTDIAYDGGLTEPQYSESLARFSYTRDALTQSIEAVFSGLDMAEHRRRGFSYRLLNVNCPSCSVSTESSRKTMKIDISLLRVGCRNHCLVIQIGRPVTSCFLLTQIRTIYRARL